MTDKEFKNKISKAMKVEIKSTRRELKLVKAYMREFNLLKRYNSLINYDFFADKICVTYRDKSLKLITDIIDIKRLRSRARA